MFERSVHVVAASLAGLLVAATMAAAQPVAQQSTMPAEKVAGDAARGAEFYTGAAVFANGGAPCLGCHGMAGFGLAGGANYGPDLTTMFENFGDEGVANTLADLSFPSMAPIYTTRPLTNSEQADLRVFFAKATGTSIPNDGLLFGEALSGALIFLGIVWMFGRERLRGVRQALVKRSGAKKEVAA